MGTLFEKNQENLGATGKKKRGGPPNRMNDLPYREWMKFQKSFFWHEDYQQLVSQFVSFFTKEVWPDGTQSRTLVLGFSKEEIEFEKNDKRDITFIKDYSFNEFQKQKEKVSNYPKYDYIFVNALKKINSEQELLDFVQNKAKGFFSFLKTALAADKYCTVLIPATPKGSPFPLAWAFALQGRDYVRLRDEKIAISKESSTLFYSLNFQNNEDERKKNGLSPGIISVKKSASNFKNWTIPKPPPRNKNELLHPAKFPETLIQDFIETFTNQEETVFDPMAGTGSTVIAALRSGRNGIGIELSEKWAKIAQQRIEPELQPNLFSSPSNQIFGKIIVGNSLKIEEIKQIKGTKFDYVITSPPYWSMLKNPGSENQRNRKQKNLTLVYSENSEDLGNEENYDVFLDKLQSLYFTVSKYLKPGKTLTIIVKNIKRNHVVYPLAWDLVRLLANNKSPYKYIGTTLWCQDDIGLKPFGVGIVWVSNIVHQYCLHFRKN